MPIFEITQDRLVPLQPTAFSSHGLRERADLQRLLRDQVEIIAPDVLVAFPFRQIHEEPSSAKLPGFPLVQGFEREAGDEA